MAKSGTAAERTFADRADAEETADFMRVRHGRDGCRWEGRRRDGMAKTAACGTFAGGTSASGVAINRTVDADVTG